jgi:hypothetical protein
MDTSYFYKNFLMMHRYTLILLLFLISGLTSTAQVIFNSSSQVYEQNFDGLANSGTNNNFTLAGWSSNRATYNAGTGSANTGAMYSFGAASSSERALGALTSQTTPLIMFGFKLQNASAEKFNGISISYTGEQWRRGTRREFSSGVPVPDTLYFEYSKDADSINDEAANWIRVAALSFISPDTTGADVAKDGNSSALQKSISSTIAVEIKNDEGAWFRWISPRFSNPVPGGIVGSKDGLAIDNLQVRVQTSTAISNIQQQLSFRVFPNPVSGNKLNVFLDKEVNGTGEAMLYALDGRVVWSSRMAFNNQMSIELPSGLPAGMYSLMLQQEGQIGLAKIVVGQ